MFLLKALLCESKEVCLVSKALYASIFCIACNHPVVFRLTRANNNDNETNDNKRVTPDDHLCTRSCSVFPNSFSPWETPMM